MNGLVLFKQAVGVIVVFNTEGISREEARMSGLARAHVKLISLSVITLAVLACNLQLGAPVDVPADPTGAVPMASSSPVSATVTASPATTQAATGVTTALPTATQGLPLAVTVSAVGGRLNVRRGPGPEYDTTGALLYGESSMATARNAQGTWLLINAPNTSTSLGWLIVTTKYTSVSGGVAGLPVMTVGPAALAYIRNCTPHEMLVNPTGGILSDRSSSPENQLQFFPGEYSVIDQTSESEVASLTVFEGRTIDIKKDSSGTSYTCP
jgi:hypothetical protein